MKLNWKNLAMALAGIFAVGAIANAQPTVQVGQAIQNLRGEWVQCVAAPMFQCRLKERDSGVIRGVFTAKSAELACIKAKIDCISSGKQCVGWSSGPALRPPEPSNSRMFVCQMKDRATGNERLPYLAETNAQACAKANEDCRENRLDCMVLNSGRVAD